MKHIGFDQSTVLNEYARIAAEKGLVKQAQEATEVVEQAEQPGQVTFEQGTTISVPVAQQAFEAFTNEVKQDRSLVGISTDLKSWKIPPGTSAVELGQLLLSQYGWQPKVKAMIDKHFPQSGGKKASEKTTKKTADGKLYDVSGETGEQLVDSAHPGGGTKTELTHSKTDENLVETIVEQQEADVEVAKSVPKGTYAALVDLYLKLRKMGYGKHLETLRVAINKVATQEDTLNYTLTVLADKLDKLGYVEAADRVDGMLKKKIAAPTAQQLQGALKDLEKQIVDKMVDTVVSKLPGGAVGGGQRAVIQNQKGKSFQQARSEIERFVNTQPELRGAYNEGLAAVTPYMNQYSVLMQQLRAVQQAPQAPAQQGEMVAKKEEEKKKEEGKAGAGEAKKSTSWRQKVLTDWPTAKKFADWYMKMMKGILGDEAFVKSEHRIPINRKEDGVTRPMRAGIQKAIAYIKENYGSGAELKKAYDAKMSGKAGKEAPKPGSAAEAGATEEVRTRMQDQIYNALVRKDPRWKDEAGLQNRIRGLIERAERYHNFADPKGYRNALRVILNQF